MSYSSVLSFNPDINKDSFLERRQAEGIEDIYFVNVLQKGEAPADPITVDLHDEVTRKVDAKTLPLDDLKGQDYVMVGDKNYRVGSVDVGGGHHVPVLREVLGRREYADETMVLIGGKLYQLERQVDPKTLRVSTYLTSTVGDLFSNDKFLADQSPAQKLELLGKIKKSATFFTWYDSGDYDRFSREKYDGEKNAQLDPAKVKHYDLGADAQKIEAGLKKAVGTPDAAPLPPGAEFLIAQSVGMILGIGIAAYAAGNARKATGSQQEFKSEAPKPVPVRKRANYQPRVKTANSWDAPSYKKRFG